MINRIRDMYEWRVIYTDGSTISEYDDPKGLGFAEIDGDRAQKVILSIGGIDVQSIDVPQGAAPVFFRRRSVPFTPDPTMSLEEMAFMAGVTLSTTAATTVAHCIGWKREDKAVYLFVRDDGSTLLTDDLQAV